MQDIFTSLTFGRNESLCVIDCRCFVIFTGITYLQHTHTHTHTRTVSQWRMIQKNWYLKKIYTNKSVHPLYLQTAARAQLFSLHILIQRKQQHHILQIRYQKGASGFTSMWTRIMSPIHVVLHLIVLPNAYFISTTQQYGSCDQTVYHVTCPTGSNTEKISLYRSNVSWHH